MDNQDGREIQFPQAEVLDMKALSDTHNDHVLQFFAYGHLPEHLQEISRPYALHASLLVESLPRNPERTVALRKLLESKDAAVRALLAG